MARVTKGGVPFATLRIAVRQERKSKDGKYHSDFFTLAVYSQQVNYLTKWCPKGTLLEACGRLEIREYKTSSGEVRYDHIIHCDLVSALERAQPHDDLPSPAEPKPEEPTVSTVSVDDDDLPF